MLTLWSANQDGICRSRLSPVARTSLNKYSSNFKETYLTLKFILQSFLNWPLVIQSKYLIILISKISSWNKKLCWSTTALNHLKQDFKNYQVPVGSHVVIACVDYRLWSNTDLKHGCTQDMPCIVCLDLKLLIHFCDLQFTIPIFELFIIGMLEGLKWSQGCWFTSQSIQRCTNSTPAPEWRISWK